jgi:predicted nucleic acid-binding protein
MLALDTDVLVAWAMEGAESHGKVRILVEGELARRTGRVVLVERVVEEFLHVVTDGKRFARPFTMGDALDYVQAALNTRDVVCLASGPAVVRRTLELLKSLRLGRKRILDTALAATLEASNVRRLATFNRADFEIFDFIDVVNPVHR